MKTCYYDVLGVDSGATEEEIRKAYRKKVLVAHPDKNLHRQEEAAAEFAYLQEAYEVLMDSQERSWYDNHKESILRDEADIPSPSHNSASRSWFTSSGTSTETLMKFFSPSVFKGFASDRKSFYSVYSFIFSQLLSEEFDPPFLSFGDASTPPASILPFYNFWLVFSTTKTFLWYEKYRLSEAPDRRVRRLMEKENAKSVETEKKKFNETVRSLAAYVRKRDPRYKAHVESLLLKQEEKAKAIKKHQMKVKQALLEEAMQYEPQAWEKVENERCEESKGEDWLEEFYCAACDKVFKSEKQFENHEKSKKHCKKMEELMDEMRQEDELYFDAVEEFQELKIEEVEQKVNLVEEQSALSETKVDERVQDEESNSEGDSVKCEIVEKSSPSNAQKLNKTQQRRLAKKEKRKEEKANESIKCNVCKQSFSSRNKLFSHIDETGHALAASGKKSKKTK